jgi:hypothetical protein
MNKIFIWLFPSKHKEIVRLLSDNNRLEKENKQIKKYIADCRSDAIKNSGTNSGLLIFIQKLEEAFTWINLKR